MDKFAMWIGYGLMVTMALLVLGMLLYLTSDLFWTMLKRNAAFPRLFAALAQYDAARDPDALDCPDCDDSNTEGACAKHALGVPTRLPQVEPSGGTDGQ